jgi:hypothetical protein
MSNWIYFSVLSTFAQNFEANCYKINIIIYDDISLFLVFKYVKRL